VKLSKGDLFSATRIEEYAGKRGIKLQAPPKALQKGYEKMLRIGLIYFVFGAEYIKEYAKERGIEVKPTKEALEEGYKNTIREQRFYEAKLVERYAKENGIKLTSKFKKKIEKQINNVGFIGIYGMSVDGKMNGEFVLGKKEGILYLIFDNRAREIVEQSKELYGLEKIFGGGKMEIDINKKKIKVYDSNIWYGYEPRMITALLLRKAFRRWEIEIEE